MEMFYALTRSSNALILLGPTEMLHSLRVVGVSLMEVATPTDGGCNTHVANLERAHFYLPRLEKVPKSCLILHRIKRPQ